MLSRRKRGKIWHVRGTVRVGDQVRVVKEHSSGLREPAACDTYITNLEKRIQEEVLYGAAGRARTLSFAEVGQRYIDRPEDLHPNDVWRIGELNEVLGDYALAEIQAGWAEFKERRCAELAPATVDRFRDTLQAALNYSAEEMGYQAPRLKRVRFKNERVRWLPIDHADLSLPGLPHPGGPAAAMAARGPGAPDPLF